MVLANRRNIISFFPVYSFFIASLSKNIEYLEERLNTVKNNYNKFKDNIWVTKIENFINEKELTYEMVDILIDSIEVCENSNIKINFKYRDEYVNLLKQSKEEE